MKKEYIEDDYRNKIAVAISKKLGTKMDINYSLSQREIIGKYNYFPYQIYETYTEYKENSLSFSYKLEEDYFQITISNGFFNHSLGQKLAVLSDFYGALHQEGIRPTLFYTTKNDRQEGVTMEWVFNKSEDRTNMLYQSKTSMQDGSIDMLEVFDTTLTTIEGTQLREETKDYLEQKLGLPLELIPIIDDNIEDYRSYKLAAHINGGTNMKSR